jgi:hypothetical protein
MLRSNIIVIIVTVVISSLGLDDKERIAEDT